MVETHEVADSTYVGERRPEEIREDIARVTATANSPRQIQF
jgi:hypothetical protein